jgi:nitrogen fixation/metabolism regulation signal transduction histidine kinase
MVAQFEEIESRMSDLSDLVERLRGHSRPAAEFETKDFVSVVEAGLPNAADEFRSCRINFRKPRFRARLQCDADALEEVVTELIRKGAEAAIACDRGSEVKVAVTLKAEGGKAAPASASACQWQPAPRWGVPFRLR